jgi:hypothetical protein
MQFLRDSSLRVRIVAVLGLAATIVTIAVGLKQLFGTDDGGGGSPRPQASGQIVLPASGDSVPRYISARGTLSNVPGDEHVWLAVRDGDLLFPQRSELLAADGRWRLDFRQGGASPTIGLDLVLMGEEAHRFVEDRLRMGNYGGIPRIPGQTILDSVENLRLR